VTQHSDPGQTEQAAPLAKPRIWTLVVAGAAALFVSLLAAGIVLVAMAFGASGGFPGPAALEAAATRPLGLAVVAVVQSTVFALAALVPAALGPVPLKVRLVLGRGRVGGLRWLLVAAATSFTGMSASGAAFNLALAARGGVRSDALETLDAAMKRAAGGELLLLFVGLALCAPLGEELFFRGYLQSRLVARAGAFYGIAITAFLFALAHFDLMHSTATFAMGLALGYAAFRAESTWVTVAAHFINNLLAVVSARAGMDETGTTTEHLSWALGFALCAAVGLRALVKLTPRQPAAPLVPSASEAREIP
jgi:membrane protease YdiL (CAAX protease family)